jgi:hypothetical protein
MTTTNNAINNFPSNRNLIIGGDFASNPWQRGVTFVAPVDNQYTADMFNWTTVGSGVVTVRKDTDVPTVAEAGIFTLNSMEVDVTTPDISLAAADRYAVAYRMEGFDWAHIAQRTCVLSFWVKSTKTGTFCIGLGNLGLDRSFITEYTITNSNVWEFKEILIEPSPSAGTWDYTNDTGLRIRWSLGMGTDFQGVTGWQTGNLLATANQVNAMDSNSNSFKLALIKIENGITVTPFELQNESDVLTQCQRYFFKTYAINTNIGTSTTSSSRGGYAVTTDVDLTACFTRLLVRMRTTPSVTWYSTTGASGNVRLLTGAANAAVTSTAFAGETAVGYPVLTAAATANGRYGAQATADASLG